MRFFMFFMAVFVFSFSGAQTHRFIYDLQYKSDSAAKDYKKENMALDINPEDVRFYNYHIVEVDSMNKVRGNRSIMWDDGIPVIIRKRNSNINRQYILLDNLFELETKDIIPWKLSEETKNSGGYLLQKATADWGGRKWTAWFSKDILLNEGPYKFRGLPGLIFEIEDSKGNYKFSMIKSYKLDKTFDSSEHLENFAGMKPIKISQDKLTKLMLDNYENPLRDFKEQFSRNTNPDNKFYVMGVEVKSPDQFKELTERTQEDMRKNNNPVELDKIIHYPAK